MADLENIAEYFPFFDQKALQSFLNSTQSGQAHEESLTQPLDLVKHLAAAFAICVFQMALFCLLRPIAKKLYQPRSYCVPIEERVDPLGTGFLSWFLPICKMKTLTYLQLGLDTYFFLRFIQVLLLYFLSCGFLNIAILLPVNIWSTRNERVTTDFQRLSMSSALAKNAKLLNFHFFCMLSSVAIFNYIIFKEMQAIVSIKHAFMESVFHRNAPSTRTLLVSNVPRDARDSETLHKKFSIFPCGLEGVWFIDDFTKYDCLASQAKDSLEIMEAASLSCVKKSNRTKSECNFSKHYGYLPIYWGPTEISFFGRTLYIRLPGILRALTFQKKVNLLDWSLSRLSQIETEIENRRISLKCGSFWKESKVFIRFKSVNSARMAHQVLLLRQRGAFDRAIIDVNPKDLIWRNLRGDDTIVSQFGNYAISFSLVLVVTLYVVPVSLIGLISQIPFTTLLFPFLKFLEKLPEEVRSMVTSFLPSVLLNILSFFQLHIFRILLTHQGTWTNSELQLKLQSWYFAFLFIHQFLVVSVSSSITVVFLQVFDLPASIPKLLAANLPSAANFFYKHLAVKALSTCGSNFLRIGPLINFYFFHPFVDRTPRAKFLRATNLPESHWGYIYPVISVYGSIGIAYCIISPLISACMTFVSSVVLLHYKYALRYVYSRDNVFETYGRLYPRALLNLYWGVYCLECCMMGIFFSQRNQYGENPTRIHGFFSLMVFMMTIFANHAILLHYSRHFEFSAVMTDVNETSRGKEKESINEDSSSIANESQLFAHPCYKHDRPVVWLPEDPCGYSRCEIQQLSLRSSAIAGGTTEGAELTYNGWFWKTRVTKGPPGTAHHDP